MSVETYPWTGHGIGYTPIQNHHPGEISRRGAHWGHRRTDPEQVGAPMPTWGGRRGQYRWRRYRGPTILVSCELSELELDVVDGGFDSSIWGRHPSNDLAADSRRSTRVVWVTSKSWKRCSHLRSLSSKRLESSSMISLVLGSMAPRRASGIG